ncbi:MAG: hypothetical protein HN344_08170, partial [Gammaproteobacteria bacterium]|nr:hypothetical protein [Gammaproteobacteria bacterium]
GTRLVNLLPDYRAIRKVRKQRFLIHFWTLLLGIPAILVVAFIHYLQWMEGEDLSQRMSQFQQLTRLIATSNHTLEQRQLRMEQLDEVIYLAEQLGDNYRQSYQLLRFVVTQVPLGIRLDGIEWEQKGQLLLKGEAQNDDEILKMVLALRDSVHFDQVSLRTISQKDEGSQSPAKGRGKKGNRREFVLECQVGQVETLDLSEKIESLDANSGEIEEKSHGH